MYIFLIITLVLCKHKYGQYTDFNVRLPVYTIFKQLKKKKKISHGFLTKTRVPVIKTH